MIAKEMCEDYYGMNTSEEMDLLAQLFSPSLGNQSSKDRLAYPNIKSEAFFYGAFEDEAKFLAEMALKHGDDPSAVVQQEQQWIDPFVVDYGNQGVPWYPDDESPPLPPYLMAGTILSPIPDVDYTHGLDGNIKQEPYSPDTIGDVKHLRSNESSPKGEDVTDYRSRISQSRKDGKSSSGSTPLIERHHKRLSDEDDGDSVSSAISETFTDGTDNSWQGSDLAMSPTTNSARLPSMPKIHTVAFPETAKRQRKDVSMSAPAVAARELRQKKKFKEEQLIQECNDLKVEAERLDKELTEARNNLSKLREDALYLRSLVRSQHSTVQLLQYLQKAPFFNKQGSVLKLDARSMLRQISGGDSERMDEEEDKIEGEKKDIGGICLHINGSEITLHLCSHCSTEASKK